MVSTVNWWTVNELKWTVFTKFLKMGKVVRKAGCSMVLCTSQSLILIWSSLLTELKSLFLASLLKWQFFTLIFRDYSHQIQLLFSHSYSLLTCSSPDHLTLQTPLAPFPLKTLILLSVSLLFGGFLLIRGWALPASWQEMQCDQALQTASHAFPTIVQTYDPKRPSLGFLPCSGMVMRKKRSG